MLLPAYSQPIGAPYYSLRICLMRGDRLVDSPLGGDAPVVMRWIAFAQTRSS